jgi:hypothetical protein
MVVEVDDGLAAVEAVSLVPPGGGADVVEKGGVEKGLARALVKAEVAADAVGNHGGAPVVA